MPMTLDSMNRAQLESLIAEHKTLFFDYGSDGFLLIHPEGSGIRHLSCLSDDQLEAAHVFLSSCAQKPVQTEEKSVCAESEPRCDATGCCAAGKNANVFPLRNRLTLDVDADVLRVPEDIISLFQTVLAETEPSGGIAIALCFHFAIQKESWAELLQSTIESLPEPTKKRIIQLTLSGPFEPISPKDRQFFIDHNIRLEFVHDLVADSFGFSEKTRFNVSHLAEMGFRVPFVWYVDDQNVDKIFPLIDEAMYLNFHSGFSLPTFQYNLAVPSTPFINLSYKHYLRLLIGVYEHHKFCDDILYPLNDIQILSINPGSSNFVRREYYERNLQKITAFPRTALTERMEAFFLRSFLWQRWKVSQTVTATNPAKPVQT